MKTAHLARPKSHAAAPAKSQTRRTDLVQLNPLIHERTRLTILTALFTAEEPGCSFSDLRDMLALTDGNLMAHLRTLEDASLIERVKEGAGRNSSTMIGLSNSGRKAFKTYLDQLETLVRAVRAK
jgi:DNA-binding MarR family transcriptional regulator